jgi:hypothetical protein
VDGRVRVPCLPLRSPISQRFHVAGAVEQIELFTLPQTLDSQPFVGRKRTWCCIQSLEADMADEDTSVEAKADGP